MRSKAWNPLKQFSIAVSIMIAVVFTLTCILGILFFSHLWIFSEKESTIQFNKGHYMILVSANEEQYDLYNTEADKMLNAVNGYTKQKDKSYVFNENSMAIIDEKKGLIEIKALAEADESEREMIKKKTLIHVSEHN